MHHGRGRRAEKCCTVREGACEVSAGQGAWGRHVGWKECIGVDKWQTLHQLGRSGNSAKWGRLISAICHLP